MRVTSQIPITNETGWLAIANSNGFNCMEKEAIIFKCSIHKEYKVYRNEDCIVIDSVPRVFRAKSRKDYTKVGIIKTLGGELMIFSIAQSEINNVSDAMSCSDIIILPVSEPKLMAWTEQTEGSDAEYTGLLCISDKVRLVLSKPEATRIHELEQIVAKALRMKGMERQITLNHIKHELLDLHFDGSNDPRLEMLASAIKLGLPHRGKHKREDYM